MDKLQVDFVDKRLPDSEDKQQLDFVGKVKPGLLDNRLVVAGVDIGCNIAAGGGSLDLLDRGSGCKHKFDFCCACRELPESLSLEHNTECLISCT